MEVFEKANADFFMTTTENLGEVNTILNQINVIGNIIDKVGMERDSLLKMFFEQVKDKSPTERADAIEKNAYFL
jgi:hypothetical protein